MKYKAVIFDLYGTLVTTFSEKEYQKVVMQMASILSVPPEPFRELWAATDAESFLGILSHDQAKIRYICDRLGLSVERGKTVKAFEILLNYEATSMLPRPEAIDVLSTLKLKGYKIGLISDCPSNTPVLWENTGLKPFFEVTIFSCAVGLRKPDPRIYQLALEQLNVKPQECLYIGDGGSNELTGALKAGMHPVLIRVPTEETYLFGAEEWKGTAISSLKEVLDLIE
jgi:putative hydrolase of the HAD superfamily